MTDREIREIRRRFHQEKGDFSKVFGCYVNEAGKIVTMFEELISAMPEEDAERFMSLLKKSVSGSLGRNLVNLEFSARQAMDSDEHRLLMALLKSGLGDDAMRELFFARVAEQLEMETGYVILLANDVYDVPFRASDDIVLSDLSEEQFRYFVCAVCPVRQPTPGLGLDIAQNRVQSTFGGLLLGAPEVGFMFPAFDNRAANVYGLLYHTKSAADNHPELIGRLFGIEPPMPAAEQMQAFCSLLTESLQEDCSLAVVQSVHAHIAQVVEEHRERKEPEQLLISKGDIRDVLAGCGVAEARIEAFSSAFDARFGRDAMLPPANLMECRQLVISTDDASIKVAPEQSAGVETRVIDGIRYILIPAGDEIAVNGVEVKLA